MIKKKKNQWNGDDVDENSKISIYIQISLQNLKDLDWVIFLKVCFC